MEEWQIVERLERYWAKTERGVVYKSASRSLFTVTCLMHDCWIFIGLLLGPRGGPSLSLVALDPSKTVVADRLFVYKRLSPMDFGNFGIRYCPAQELRQQLARPGTDKHGVCTEALYACVESMMTGPHSADLRAILQAESDTTDSSVIALYSAGSPGLVQQRRIRRG
ncbi:MAG: hypothetical protein EXS55_03330 [Candidatus Magasanikbacteria bacterium]|nr:hypothetical protein [Candidatus Magasanikbacteria bacterium]